MIFMPFVFLYVYSLAALGYVLLGALYILRVIAYVLMIVIPIELVWRSFNIILGI